MGNQLGIQQHFGMETLNSNVYGGGGRLPQTSTETLISLPQNVSTFSTLSPYTNIASTYSQTGGIGGIMLPSVIHTGLDVGAQFKDIRTQLPDITQQSCRQTDQSVPQQSFDTLSNIGGQNNPQKIPSFNTHTQLASESPTRSADLEAQLSHSGQTRQYVVHVPESVTEAVSRSPGVSSTEATQSFPELTNSQTLSSERTFIYSNETSNSAVLEAFPSVSESMSESAKKAQASMEEISGSPTETDIAEQPQNNADALMEQDPSTSFNQMQSQLVKTESENFLSELQHQSENRTKNDHVEELEETMKQYRAEGEKQITTPTSENKVIIDKNTGSDKTNLTDQVISSEIQAQKITDDVKSNSAKQLQSIPEVVEESLESSYDGAERRNDIGQDTTQEEVESSKDQMNLEATQKSDATNNLPEVKDKISKDELTCCKCNQEFKTHGGLKRHMTRKHGKFSLNVEIRGKKHTCTACQKICRTKLLLQAHMKTHEVSSKMQMRQSLGRKVKKSRAGLSEEINSTSDTDSSGVNGKHVCKVCLKTFKNAKALNMHKISHKKLKHGPAKRKTSEKDKDDGAEDPLSCKICSKKFKSKKGMDRHFENHDKKSLSCDYCNETFQFKKDLNQHKRTTHKEEMANDSRERSHVCSFCAKCFLEKSHLREHEKRHGEPDIPCPKCDKKFKFISDMRKHQRAHSDHKPYICTTCGATFKASCHLSEHELRHGEAKYSCQHCHKKYYVEREMKKHEKTHTDKIYPCPHCAEEFHSKSDLKSHEIEHEQAGTITIKQYLCTHCNLYFSSQRGLLHHLNNKHKEQLKPEERWQFTCEECGRVCPSQEALRHHKNLHKGKRIFPCSKCEKFFKSAQHLREHEKRHGEPTLSCSICGWKFVLQVDLRKHERRHAMKKSLSCTHCDKKFSTNGALNAHIKRHTQSASSFVCTYCKLGFRSNLGLKYHLNHKHLEKLPQSERWTHLCDHCNKVFPTKSSVLRHKEMQGRFSCQICNLNFRTEKAYKQHQQIHLGLRNHCCPICKKGFMKSHHLAEHMKRHSEGKNPCRLCGKKYVFLTDLRKHMKLSHFSPKLETCTQCNKKFLGERMLRQHVLLHHQAPVEKQYICYDCNLQFSGRKGLTSHMNNKHREKLSVKERWKFQCKTCNRMFRSAKALEVHGKVHSSLRPHECSQCGKRFKEARHLLEHEMRHQEGQFPCPECDKKYVFFRDLVKHLKTHSEVKEFECSKCGKGFAKNSDLHAHLLRHEQSKNNNDSTKTIHCWHCSLKFVHKKGLDAHMNNKHRELLDETQRWPFWCERCKKAFRTKAAMNKHEPEHLGKRDYVCSICHKTFKEPRHLSEHQKRHEKPTLKCQFCEKMYVFERDLQKHERTHSEEKPFK